MQVAGHCTLRGNEDIEERGKYSDWSLMETQEKYKSCPGGSVLNCYLPPIA